FMNKISEDMAVVDTISSDLAILLVGPEEEEKIVEVVDLPEGTWEGDWLKISEDDEFELAPKVNEERKKIVQSKLKKLRKNQH
ncbi:MAG: DUF3006 domain-containing protein, partial [Bacteriovoracia bacterium]